MPVGFPYKSLLNQVYLPYFYQKGEGAIPFLVQSNASRKCFMAAYRDLPPFETIDHEEQFRMQEYVKELFPEKDIEEVLQASKIIYTIGTISN